MKKLYFMTLTVIFSTTFFACTEDKNDPTGDNKKGLSYDFTIEKGKTEYKYEVNGAVYTGDCQIHNSLNRDKYLPVNFGGQYPYGGIPWLPQKTGTFKGGDLLGEGKGSTTNKIYFNMSVHHDGKLYYAYSTNPYGNIEEYVLDGTDVILTIKKFEGDYVGYRLQGYSLSSFVGQVDALFEGTFKTEDGESSIQVKKGELRIDSSLPPGAEVIE